MQTDDAFNGAEQDDADLTVAADPLAIDLGDDLDDPDRRVSPAPENPPRHGRETRPRESATGVDPIDARPAEAPRPLPDGHVEVSALTDEGVLVRMMLPVDHPGLPALLSRRTTRVRRTAPGVSLPTVVEPAAVQPEAA